MGSKKITRMCPGYGSVQNFPGYFAGLVKSFLKILGTTNKGNAAGPGPARPGRLGQPGPEVGPEARADPIKPKFTF